MKTIDLVNHINDISFDQALEYVIKNAKIAGKKTFLVTINPELVMLAKEDSEYEGVLKSANLAVADGIGIILAGKMYRKSFSGRIHGSDLLEKLPELASKEGLSIGLLGGGKNVALKVSKRLVKKYPDLKIAFAQAEWGDIKGKKECDILFVAFGSPKQEKWINENLQKRGLKVAIGVGGAFDFLSGRVKRAPKWVRRIGMEWLFRLIIQPWRIKRQVALVKFTLLVTKERFL